jgi:hypothetical protein
VIPTTIHGFASLLCAAFLAGIGYTVGAWLVGKVLK